MIIPLNINVFVLAPLPLIDCAVGYPFERVDVHAARVLVYSVETSSVAVIMKSWRGLAFR
jgi:hypothetical protein